MFSRTVQPDGTVITAFTCQCDEESIGLRMCEQQQDEYEQMEKERERHIAQMKAIDALTPRNVHRELGDPPGKIINLGARVNQIPSTCRRIAHG